MEIYNPRWSIVRESYLDILGVVCATMGTLVTGFRANNIRAASGFDYLTAISKAITEYPVESAPMFMGILYCVGKLAVGREDSIHHEGDK